MAEGIKFVLVGHDIDEMTGLAKCLKLIGLDVETLCIAEAEQWSFDSRHIVIVDVDCQQGSQLSRRLVKESPDCLLATLSEHDRRPDRVMHILKPLGFIDVQILLIRAGAITY